MKNNKIIFKVMLLILLSSLSFKSMLTYAESTTAKSSQMSENTSTQNIIPPTAVESINSVEKVHNPYGLNAIWQEGDFVAKGTLIIMLLMSIGSWYFILIKFLQQFKLKRQAHSSRQIFEKANDLPEAIQRLSQQGAYQLIVKKAYSSMQNYSDQMMSKIDFNTWVTLNIQRGIEQTQGRLSGGLAFLATVGSTAPFIGLFGTVWGIYHALTAIGISGQASIDKVAGPVGEALIMTALGLAVAVPAVLGYNWLVRRNKVILDDLRTFGADLHSTVLSGTMASKKTTDETSNTNQVMES